MCQNCDPAPGPHPKNTSSTPESCSGQVCENECADSQEVNRSAEPKEPTVEKPAHAKP